MADQSIVGIPLQQRDRTKNKYRQALDNVDSSAWANLKDCGSNHRVHRGRNSSLVNSADCSIPPCGAIRGGAAIAPYGLKNAPYRVDIVPTVSVGTPMVTLCVMHRRSGAVCIPTRSVGTIKNDKAVCPPYLASGAGRDL